MRRAVLISVLVAIAAIIASVLVVVLTSGSSQSTHSDSMSVLSPPHQANSTSSTFTMNPSSSQT